MKKIILWALLWGLAGPLSALGVSTALGFNQGLVYGDSLSLGPSGSSVEILGTFEADQLFTGLSWGGGVELGVSGLGAQMLFPLGLEWSSPLGSPWVWSSSFHILPGFTLTRPYPLFLLGAQALISGGWSWGPGGALMVTTGVKWVTCPEYSQKVALYSLWDLPLKFGVVLYL